MPPLIQIIDAALASATQRSGSHLVCRPGCTQCCHGIFAISQQDAARLHEGLAQLTASDPTRAASVRTRIATSVTRLTPHFPGDPTTGVLSDDYDDSALFDDPAFDNEPCPVLDPTAGTCDLYAHRPILCRTFGPPMRDDDGNLTHCELCYTKASTKHILTCELDPALPEIIDTSDRSFNSEHKLTGETLIAFALRAT